jgi:hypothetical protein
LISDISFFSLHPEIIWNDLPFPLRILSLAPATFLINSGIELVTYSQFEP